MLCGLLDVHQCSNNSVLSVELTSIVPISGT